MSIAFTINVDERGLLFRNGRLIEWLGPGRHHRSALFGCLELRRQRADTVVSPCNSDLARVAPGEAAQEVLFVAEQRMGLVLQDGIPSQVLAPGRYLVWRVKSSLEVRLLYASGVCPGGLEPLQALPNERAFRYQDGLLTDIVHPASPSH